MHAPLLRQESSTSVGVSGKQARPRVLLIAEAANPALTSAALVAWSCARAMMEVCDAHLVTELRNREDILKAGLKESQVTFINARKSQHAARCV